MEKPEVGKESNWFRMPAGLFLRTIIFQNGKTWICFFGLLVFIGVISGIVADYRYAIIALMVLFILLPMGLLFIYLYYGFYETYYLNIILHKIIINNSEIRILMKWVNSGEDNCTDEDGDGFNKSISYKKELFGNLIALKDSVIILTKSSKGFIWLPVSAFDDEKSFTSFINNMIE